MDEIQVQRINKVVDYIQFNLASELPISTLADISCYSEFHFNRIFKKVLGQSVHQFVQRLRIEKAADRLIAYPQESITEIGLLCGFSTSSSFAKCFKQYFRVNATNWRSAVLAAENSASGHTLNQVKKISFIDGKTCWNYAVGEQTRRVELEDIPPTKIIYVRNIGAYQANEALFKELYDRLFSWAVPRGLVKPESNLFNIYSDNPQITNTEFLRVMIALPVYEKVKSSGQIGLSLMKGGQYGVCRFTLKNGEFQSAWDWMYQVWLPRSGFEIDDREVFERSVNVEHGETTQYTVDICIPIRPK